MNVICPRCGADYDVNSERVSGDDVEMKCSKCLHTFTVHSDGVAAAGQGEVDMRGVTFLGSQNVSLDDGQEVERFYVKRSSGKVFGPFEKRLIEQMVRSNKLTGGEDVSLDKESWVSLRSIVAFEEDVDPEVGGMTQIPGRPGPVVGMDDDIGFDDFNDDLDSLYNDEEPGGDPELPAPLYIGLEGDAELPLALSPPELPVPLMSDAELPAPIRGGSELPIPVGSELPISIGTELPVPTGGMELPISRSPGLGVDAEMPLPKGADNDFFSSGNEDLNADLVSKGFVSSGDELFGEQMADGVGAFGTFATSDGIEPFGAGQAEQGFSPQPQSPLGGQGPFPSFEDELPEEPPEQDLWSAEDELPDLPDQQEASSGADEKPKKKVRRSKKRVALPLVAAILFLGGSLIVVVGLLLVNFGIIGGEGEVEAPPKKVEVVKPQKKEVSFDKIKGDTYDTYTAFIEESRKGVKANGSDLGLKSQLMVAYVLYDAHYPEDQKYKKEAAALGVAFDGDVGKDGRLGAGALSVLKAEADLDLLSELADTKKYGYIANLLLGISSLSMERPVTPVVRARPAPKKKPSKAKDDAAGKEDPPPSDAKEADGDKADGDKADGDKADGDKADDDKPKRVEMSAEELKAARALSLKHLKKAAKLEPKLPAPRYFAAIIEINGRRKGRARKLLTKALAKAPEHVPSLLEMSYLSYLDGDLEVAGDHAKTIIENHEKTSSKRELSRAHLVIGLVHMARLRSDDAVEAFKESLKVDASNSAALKALGKEFFRKQKFEEALSYLTTNSQLGKNDPEVMLAVVKCHIGLEDYKMAVKKLEVGAKVFVEDPRFPFFLGLIHEKEGHWFDAQQSYRRSLEIDDDFSKSRVRLALLLLKDDKEDEAVKFLEEAVKRGAANDTDVAVDIGQAYILLGDKEKALEILQAALKVNANNLDARIKLARHYFEGGDSEKALKMLSPFMDTKSLDTGLALLLSDVFRGQGKYERSIEQLDRLIENDPVNPKYIFKRGLSYFGWKNYETAKDQFLKAYGLKPSFVHAYFYAGRVDFEQKDYANAMKVFRSALDDDPTNGDYRFYLAFALEKSSNDVQALQEYSEIDRFDAAYGKKNPELYYRRGRLLTKVGKNRQAKRDLFRLLKLRPDHLGALLALGDTLLDEKEYERALVLYDKALEKKDDLKVTHFNRGECLVKLDQLRSAAKAFERAKALGFKRAVVFERLGYIYKGMGDSAKMRKNFKRYLELKPKAPNRKEIKKFL